MDYSTQFGAMFEEQFEATMTAYQSQGQVDNLIDEILQPTFRSQPFVLKTGQPAVHPPLSGLGEESRSYQPHIPSRPTYTTQPLSVEPESNMSSFAYGSNGSSSSGRLGMNARRHTETQESEGYLTSTSSCGHGQSLAGIGSPHAAFDVRHSNIPSMQGGNGGRSS